MPWPAILGAVAGSAVSGLFNQSAAESAQDFGAWQSQMNREFQERMRATQYQTAVKDMAAAGLNPMLAYHMGGAGTPQGSSAQGVQAHPIENPSHTANEAAKAWTEIKQKEQEMAIKKPLESISGSAEKGIEAVKEIVKPLSEKLSDVVRSVEDKLRDGSLTTATADRVDKTVESARAFANDIAERIMSPTRELSKNTSSAASAAARRAGEAIHGPKGVKPPESKGKIPREHQQRLRKYEWKFNYTP